MSNILTDELNRIRIAAGIELEYSMECDSVWNVGDKELIAFAAIVASEERQKCADLCDKYISEESNLSTEYVTAHELANEIRLRSYKE
jgi:hypothetical protein